MWYNFQKELFFYPEIFDNMIISGENYIMEIR